MNSRDKVTQVMYSIAAVERDTGIGKDTLRVWERRYGFPEPSRDAHGERTYPIEQVEKLRVIKRLMDQGHRPGRIVAQSMDALQHLSQGHDNLTMARLAQITSGGDDLQQYIGRLQTHQIEELRRELSKALSQNGLQKFVTELVAPLTSMVGAAWAQGDLAVHEEHAYTECVESLLRQAIGALPRAAAGAEPTVLLTTFPQEAHGLGLLMAESLFALNGCRCVSLGTQTPVRDIAHAALMHNANVVALSFSVNMNPNHVVEGLAELSELLPTSVSIWAGGQSPALRRKSLTRVKVLSGLTAIEDAIKTWRA
jgi:DNA-binding transcriptional MerR regulator/methylmalonyl-CoA mutase cobalamin-binding subunit